MIDPRIMSDEPSLPPTHPPHFDASPTADEEARLPRGASTGVLPRRVDAPAVPDASGREHERRERLRRSTITGGLSAVPAGFDDPAGDWQAINAEDPFEVLYLDSAQHKSITAKMVAQTTTCSARSGSKRSARRSRAR